LVSFWPLCGSEGFFEVRDAEAHIGGHVSVLGQIVHYSMHNAFAHDQIVDVLGDSVVEEVLALAEHTSSSPSCLVPHQLHSGIVTA
jgi:hypothetical protein